jgi:uncharacterized membrane protein YedE/YeeE
MESDTMTASLATLIVGVVIGYLGQRSRMCFVGGIRDFILVRDTYLIKGLLAFAITSWIAFPVAGLLAGTHPLRLSAVDAIAIVLTIIGGFGVGYVSTLANGCPFRQHVLAAQGVTSSIAYLGGFVAGAVVFHSWTTRVLVHFLP